MLVSVTIPVFNDPGGLKRSLKSLQNQTYTKWEAIVVDDGSLNDLTPIINEINDERIVFHRFTDNRGRPTARQKTFELLKGDFCAFLDAGDTYIPTYLENAIKYFGSKEILGVSQSMTIVYDGEKYQSTYINEEFDVNDPKFNRISFASTIFDSKVCEKYLFNSKLKFSQDRHFLNYVATQNEGRIALINSHGYVYRQGKAMKVSTTFRKYYYDLLRLLDEGKYFEVVKGLPKLFIFPILHLCMGYKFLLNMRFQKLKQ